MQNANRLFFNKFIKKIEKAIRCRSNAAIFDEAEFINWFCAEETSCKIKTLIKAALGDIFHVRIFTSRGALSGHFLYLFFNNPIKVKNFLYDLKSIAYKS